MKVQYQPKQQYLLNTFLLFFIFHAMQVGIGIQAFERIIFSEAKQDAWISVVLAGIFSHVVVYIMIKTLQINGTSDIYGIQITVYGKWIGKILNCFFIFYCLLAFMIILKNYIEVLQTWIFPTVPTWLFSVSILLLVIYGFTGGIRVIVGVCFFSFILSIWMLGLIGYPLRYSELNHLLPIMEANIVSIIKGTHKMTLTIIGFEILYVVYPFLKEKDKVQKFAHLGIAATNILYLLLMLLSIIYFSPGQLEKTIWPSLTLFKIIKLPFIERIEYVIITFWLLIILPNLLLYLWAAIQGVKRTFGKKSKWVLLIFTLFIFIPSLFFNSRININRLNHYFSIIAFYIVFCYPFILYALSLIRKKLTSTMEKMQ